MANGAELMIPDFDVQSAANEVSQGGFTALKMNPAQDLEAVVPARRQSARQDNQARQQLAQMRQEMREMQTAIERLNNPQREAPGTFLGSQNRHISPHAVFRIDDAKGGMLMTDPVTVPITAAPQTFTAQFSGDDAARITNTVVEFVSFVATDGIADQFTLSEFRISSKVFGRDSGQLFRVPSVAAAPELFGEESLYPVGARVGSDGRVTFEVELLNALTNPQQEQFKIVAYCGDGTQYQKWARSK